MRRLRLWPLLMALTMTLTLLPVTALAADPVPTGTDWLVPRVRTYGGCFQDDDAWCADAMQTVYEAGLMEGKTAARFDSVSPLTHAQITVIAARLYDLLIGGDGVLPSPAGDEAWYRPAYDTLVKAGVLQENDRGTYHDGLYFYDSSADKPCRREFFVEVLGSVLTAAQAELPRLNQVDLIPDLSADSTGYIHDFYDYGILNGADAYGGFHATGDLTRGQAAAMLARIIDPAQRLTFTLPSFDFCRDILQMDPKAVMMEVDGIEITAEQIAVSLRRMAHPDLDLNGVFDMARTDAVNTVAAQRLAEELGLQPDPEMFAQAEEFAEAHAGHLGLTKEGYLWEARQSIWESALTPYIVRKYGDKGYTEGMKAELAAKGATLPYAQTRAYESFIDWNRARQLCLTAPVYEG
jgi:hypothetical protein